MVKPVDPSVSIPYVCKADLAVDKDGNPRVPEAERTTWHLRVPNVSDEAEMKHLSLHGGGPHAGRAIMDFLRVGLMDVENFRNADGSVIEFKKEERVVFGRRRQVVADAFLDRVPWGLKDELADAISNGSGIPEPDAKNS